MSERIPLAHEFTVTNKKFYVHGHCCCFIKSDIKTVFISKTDMTKIQTACTKEPLPSNIVNDHHDVKKPRIIIFVRISGFSMTIVQSEWNGCIYCMCMIGI